MASTPVISVEAPSCPVSGVVVYLDRADVTRSVEVDLFHGENEVVVKQLSSAIDSDSIRVEGRGLATIGEVKYQEKHVSEDDNDDNPAVAETGGKAQAAIKELEREKTRLAKAMAKIKAMGQRVRQQREFLEKLATQVNSNDAGAAAVPVESAKKAAIKKMLAAEPKSEVHGPAALLTAQDLSSSVLAMMSEQSLESIIQFMEFYSKRSRELDEKLAAVKKEETELKNQLQAVTSNLQMRGKTGGGQTEKKGMRTERTVTIIVTAEKGVKATLYLSYVVMDAGWEPQYDLRVFSKDKLLKIHYFALISQSTGEDWNDAPLVLSTAQPSIGGSPPQLDTKKLSFVRHIAKRQYNLHSKQANAVNLLWNAESCCICDDDEENLQLMTAGLRYSRSQSIVPSSDRHQQIRRSQIKPPPKLAVQEAEVSGTVTSTSFEIPRRTSIPADGTLHKVAVGIVDLKPAFEYETVPKRVAHAFLKAQVKNTSQFAFLQGPANVFLDNNFISKTSLDDVSPHENFTCSLGVDPAIRVVYKPVRRYKETTGLFSKSTVVTLRQSIELNNTRLDSVKIKVTDVLPVTSEETIKVGVLKPEVSRKDPSRSVAGGHVTLTKDNLLEWQLEIAATTQHTVEFSYNVEYPASHHEVSGLQ